MSHKILTAEDVLTIQARLDAGESGSSIARDFGVSPQAVSSIKTGECWGTVTGKSARIPGEHANRGKLSREDVLAIDAGLRAGVPAAQLARDFGIAPSTVYLLRLGKTWAWLTGRPVCEVSRG